MKLLITSVGSLLGQNILDSIESRRNLIRVVGMNTIVENPRNFRCDTVYLVHKTNSDKFLEDFTTIVEKEKPDFILPGRDEDCIFLSDFKSNHPEKFGKKIPFGNSLIPIVMFDKYQSHLFCKTNQLAFANSYLYTEENDREGLNDFIDKQGFPLLVKPREGFASQGVHFVLNNDQVSELVREGEVLFQEYLGNPDEIFKHKNLFKKGYHCFSRYQKKNNMPHKQSYLRMVQLVKCFLLLTL